MDESRKEDIERLRRTMPIPKKGERRFLDRRTWAAVLAVAVFGVFFMPPAASALGVGGTLAFILAMIVYYLTSFVGQMLLILVGGLIFIAQYNGFVDSPPVANGWTIVRDIANMFFIVALLLIAFGTMLGLGSNYDYKQALPRFVIMAILVNFSRTICGLIIDFAQVVMLTFVNGFKEAAGGNFVDAFQITELMQLNPGDTGSDTPPPDFDWSITLSMLLALAFVCVATVVVIIMIAVLVVRIVYLWLLIVMSPLAFLASAVPIGKAKGFYADWWDKFNNQVLVGPFLAFFLWLALISVASGGIATEGFPEGSSSTGESVGADEVSSSAGFRTVGEQGIQQFIIAIGLMLGGVAMAQQMSGSAVNMGKGLAKGAGKLAMRAGKAAGKAAYQWSGAERAVDRTKERMYTGLGKIPVVGGIGRRRAALARQTIAQKSTADEKMMSYMSSNELKKEMSRPALSAAQVGVKKAATKEMLRRTADVDVPEKDKLNRKDAKDSKLYYGARKEMDRLAKTTYDKSGVQAFAKFERKKQDWIVDPNASADEQRKQHERKRTYESLETKSSLLEKDSDEITGSLVKNASTSVVASAMQEANAAQFDKLAKELKFTAEEIGAFKTASPGDKVKLVAEGQKRIESKFEEKTDAGKAGTIKNMHAGGNLEGIRDIGVQKLSLMDPAAVSGDADLAKALGDALDGSDIQKLPTEMANAIRDSLTDAPDKYLAAGGNLNEVLKGVDMNSGNAADNASRAGLYRRLNEADIAANPKFVDEKALASNNGINDYSMALLENLKQDKYDPATGEVTEKGDVRKLLEAGELGKVRAIMQAANGIETGEALSVMESQSKSMERAGKTPEEIETFRNGFLDRHARAQESARMLGMQAGGGLRAEMSGMSFAGRAGKVAKAGKEAAVEYGGAALRYGQREAGDVLKQAAKEAGRSIAAGAKEGARYTAEGAKAAGKIAAEGSNRAVREARRRAGGVAGRAGQFRRRIF